MITETLARAANIDREPETPGLRFHKHCAFDKPDTGEKFYAKCFAFEERKADLVAWANERLEQLARGSVLAFLTDREGVKAEWASMTRDIVTERVALAWDRRATMQAETPAQAKQIAKYRTAYEKFVADEIENLCGLGIDSAMQAASANPKAAMHQLRVEAEKREWCMAAKGDLNCAIEAARVLEAQLEAIPTFNSCSIQWPAFTPGAASEIASMIGLEQSTTPERPDLSPRGRRIVRDFGLDNSPLLAAHVAAVSKLDGMLTGDWYHPLSTVTDKQLPDVRKYVEQLPATNLVRQFLSNTAKGIPTYVL